MTLHRLRLGTIAKVSSNQDDFFSRLQPMAIDLVLQTRDNAIMEKPLKGESMIKAPVNRIIPFSNVDGPGNRFVVFFQNCPFNCLFCHNPETINTCINCGDCVAVCPVQALSFKNDLVVWNKEVCVQCDSCIKACQHFSSPKVVMMSVEEIMAEMQQVEPYIRGITVSGGECMSHPEFLLSLFKAVKEKRLSCLIDSNGAYDFSKYEELVDISDGVMLDLKAIDSQFHQLICGADNDMVLRNLRYLLKKNKLFEVRTVIFPDQEAENIRTVKAVAKIVGNKCRYKLIKYRHYGVRDSGTNFFGESSPSQEEMQKLQEIAIENGASQVTIT